MKTFRLGATDIEISPIGLGCLQFSQGFTERLFPKVPQETASSVVRAALDGGITWFDTAEAYGQGASERVLTTALRENDIGPGTVTIATKWKTRWRTAASIGATIEDRLAALQGYPIDLHQIHMNVGSFSSHAAQIRAMARLCHAGRISAVGVSNFTAKQMERAHELLRAEGLTLASNQVHISLASRNIERNGVLETARRLGITLIAYSPLRQGLLSGKFHGNPERIKSLPRLRRMVMVNGKALARTAPLIDEMRQIAEAHGASVSQVALAWLIGFYEGQVVAIPGASKPAHAAESAGAMELRLTGKELEALDRLSRQPAPQ